MRVAYRVSYQVLNWENCCLWTAFMDVWTTEFAVRDYISETQTANYWQLLHIVKHESCDTKLPCCWHHRDNWCREGGGGQTRGCSVSDPTIHLPLHESSTRSSSSLSPSFRMSTLKRLASSPHCTSSSVCCTMSVKQRIARVHLRYNAHSCYTKWNDHDPNMQRLDNQWNILTIALSYDTILCD